MIGKKLDLGWVAFLMLLTGLVVSACSDAPPPSSTQVQNAAQENQLKTGVDAVGIPSIKQWAEMRMLKDLYELRDKQVATYIYLKDANGPLRCYGEGIGYGLPYAAQFTAPERVVTGGYSSSAWAVTIPQPEPNGLNMPASADATWYMLKGPDGTVKPDYIEEKVIVSQFQKPCKPLDAP